ncbi:MerC domain-containing protein [Sphingomonas sp.]|uniref:MerC domain-containing protein n=1 Tax=Sphingomonas sp. TaxID=28214 RepID=UPI002DD641F7|nr:MerC domain-containing protein [Sphingomonas sp.]
MSISSTAARAGRRARGSMPIFDRLAIGASCACLAHCLLLPLLIAAGPALAQLLDVPESFHLLAFGMVVPISAVAMLRGFRRHGIWLPIGLSVASLACLGIGAAAGLPALYETGLSVGGSLVLAIGHIINWRLPTKRSLPASPLGMTGGPIAK